MQLDAFTWDAYDALMQLGAYKKTTRTYVHTQNAGNSLSVTTALGSVTKHHT